MFLMRWYRKRQRDFDRKHLFPLLKQMAREETYRRNNTDVSYAIFTHIAIDPAWRYEAEWEHEDIETGAFRCCGPHCDH